MKIYTIIELNRELDIDVGYYVESGITGWMQSYKNEELANKRCHQHNVGEFRSWANDNVLNLVYGFVDSEHLTKILKENNIDYFVERNKQEINYIELLDKLDVLPYWEQVMAYSCFHFEFYRVIESELVD